jgi:WD40 repeat protein
VDGISLSGLSDDFYTSVIDWSSAGYVALALAKDVHIFDPSTHGSLQLDTGVEELVSSVRWSEDGQHLAVGLESGSALIYDLALRRFIRLLRPHAQRVLAADWSGSVLATGSRGGDVVFSDLRIKQATVGALSAHAEDVCGLAFSSDRASLATGGGDHLAKVWDLRETSEARHTLYDHAGAVKALAWSPHQRGLLATGGGSSDRTLRLWETSAALAHCRSVVDTGSQVTSVAWSRTSSELATGHGYNMHSVCLWSAPTLAKVADLKAHEGRVLGLAVSPDGSLLASVGVGAEPEQSRLWFWDAFSPSVGETGAVGVVGGSGVCGRACRQDVAFLR